MITAALQLQAPSTQQIQSVRQQIIAGLGKNVQLGIAINTQSLAAAQKQVSSLNQTLNQTVTLNQSLAGASQSAAVSVGKLGTAYAVYSKIRAELSNATSEAVNFNDEIIRTRQITKASAGETEELAKATLGLSTATGTSAYELAKLQRFILSAGVSAYDTKEALEGLAKAAQTANFSSLGESTEAVLALFNAFHESGKDVASDLELMTTLSAKFAVEQYQIVEGVKKSGVVIKDLGGDFRQFAELFTLVESSTREDASAIGNSLKALFVYLQRNNVREYLKHNLGVDTRDAEGQFRKPLEIIQDLQHALRGIKPTSPVFSGLIDQLGVRNVSRLLPLLTDEEKLTRIVAAAQKSGSETAAQYAIRQETVAQQIKRVRQELVELIYSIGNNKAFKDLATAMLDTAHGAVSLAHGLNALTSFHIPKELLGLAGLLGGGRLLASGGPFGRIAGAALLSSSVGRVTGNNQTSGIIADNAINFLLARSFVPKNFGAGLGNKAFDSLAGLSQRGAAGNFLATGLTRSAYAFPGRFGTAANLGLFGAFAGSAVNGLAQQNIAAGHYDTARNQSAVSSALSYGGTGAGIGFLAGGPVGALIGGTAGAVYGLKSGQLDAEDEIKRAKLHRANEAVGTQLDKFNSGKGGFEGDKFSRNVKQLLENGGSLSGASPQIEAAVHKLAGESKSFSEFQDKGGTKALAAFVTSLDLTTDEMRKLLEATKREIEIKGALNRANQKWDSETLHISDIVNRSQLAIEGSQKRLNVANATGSLNVNAIPFEQAFGPESAALKGAEHSIPDIVRKFKRSGKAEDAIPGNLPPGIAAHLHDALNQFHDTAGTAREEDIRKALEGSIAEQRGNVQAGINASRERLAARQQEHGFARSTQLEADSRRATLGSSDVSANVLGQSLTPAQIAGQLRAAIGRSQALASASQNPANAGRVDQLNEAREKELTVIHRLQNAMDLLASSTGNLARRQDDVAFKRAKFAGESSFFEQQAFGAPDEVARQQRAVELANQVGSGQIPAATLSPQDLQDIHGVLKQIGGTRTNLLGGKTGDEVLGSIVEQRTGFKVTSQLAQTQKQLDIEVERTREVQKQAEVERSKLADFLAGLARVKGVPGIPAQIPGVVPPSPVPGVPPAAAALQRGEIPQGGDPLAALDNLLGRKPGAGGFGFLPAMAELQAGANPVDDSNIAAQKQAKAALDASDLSDDDKTELKRNFNPPSVPNLGKRDFDDFGPGAPFTAMPVQGMFNAAEPGQGVGFHPAAPQGLFNAGEPGLGVALSRPFTPLPQQGLFNAGKPGLGVGLARGAAASVPDMSPVAGGGASLASPDFSKFGGHVDNLNKAAETLSGLKGLDVSHEFKGQVEVIMNGADVMREIMPGLQEYMNAQINVAFNEFVRQKLPQLGRVDSLTQNAPKPKSGGGGEGGAIG